MDQDTHHNPLFEMSLSTSDHYNLQQDALKPAKPRRQWSFTLIIIYVILQTALDAFLIYKVVMLDSTPERRMSQKDRYVYNSLRGDEFIIHNNSQETENLRSDLGVLQNQVKSLGGEEGQIGRLRADLNLLNTSNINLENKFSNISLKAGPPGMNGLPGLRGQKGETGPKGDSGVSGPAGQKGQTGLKGETGDLGKSGLSGPKGNQGAPGIKGEPGISGPPGLRGEKGESGTSAQTGPPGPTGIKGPKGDSGAIGPQGIPGLRGPAGFNGTQGPPGPQGLKGEKGETGQRQIVKVRLVPGENRGRVEVLHNNVWGTVCDDSFEMFDGRVICKMLGFQSVVSTFTASPGSGEIWLDELKCTGTESDVFDCPHNEVGIHNCSHDEDAGIQCV